MSTPLERSSPRVGDTTERKKLHAGRGAVGKVAVLVGKRLTYARLTA